MRPFCFAAFGVLVFVWALTGCATTRPSLQLVSQFQPEMMAYALEPGGGRIEGQAFMRQRGGGVVTAAGEPVMLMPAVPYTNEMMTKSERERNKGPYGAQVDFANLDPRFQSYVKQTTADATGSFMFEGLSPGDYFLLTRVRWQVPTGSYFSAAQGGELIQRVTIPGPQTVRVIMSQ